MAEPGLSELITTTLRARTGKIFDNVSNNDPLLMRMKKSGNVKMGEHGRSLIEEHDYAENQSFMRYEGGEVLDTSRAPVLSAFEYSFKQAAVNVQINGLEEIQNAGPEASIKLFAARLANAERTIKNRIASDIRSDGTLDGGKSIGGLDLLFPEDPTTGSVGGVSRSANSYARSKKIAAVADDGAAISITSIERLMRSLMIQTHRDGDTNRLWVLGNDLWALLSEAASSRQRFVESDQDMAKIGVSSIKVDGVTAILGGGYQFAASGATAHDSTTAYLLNLDTIKLRIGGNRFFSPLSDRESTNQDSKIKFLVFAGNLTCCNFGLNARLFNS